MNIILCAMGRVEKTDSAQAIREAYMQGLMIVHLVVAGDHMRAST